MSNYMNLINRKLLTNCWSYLKASNNYSQTKCFHSLVLSKIMRKNTINNNNNYNKVMIDSTLNNSKVFNLSFCQLLLKRNQSNNSSEDFQSKNDLSESNSNDGQNLRKSFETKFKTFKDEDSEVILDVSEELILNEDKGQSHEQLPQEIEEEFYLYREKKPKTKLDKMNLKRGITGVFDIQELVQLLRDENMKDIAVIKVPKEMRYCDFLVLANAKSLRHLKVFYYLICCFETIYYFICCFETICYFICCFEIIYYLLLFRLSLSLLIKFTKSKRIKRIRFLILVEIIPMIGK